MNKEQRNSLRKKMLAKRDRLSDVEREEKSSRITSSVMALSDMNRAHVILVYMHFRSEVQTSVIIRQMLARKQQVTIPYTHVRTSHLSAIEITDTETQVTSGYCGIPEPLPEQVEHASCDPKKIDVVIVPGSVFDRSGGRLGYGGGYYDRFLAQQAPQAVKIGLAFELQLVDRVPVEPHDQFMDFIVTEKNLYDCRRNGNAKNNCVSR